MSFLLYLAEKVIAMIEAKRSVKTKNICEMRLWTTVNIVDRK